MSKLPSRLALALAAVALPSAAPAATLAPATVVAATAADEERPRLAYSAPRDEYLAVWHEARTAPAPGEPALVVRARRLDLRGLPLGPAFDVAPVEDGRDRRDPAVAWDPSGDRWLVVYLYDYADGADWDVRGRFVPGSGPGPVEEELVIAQSADAERAPRVAFAADGLYLATWWVEAAPSWVQASVGRYGERPASPAAIAYAIGSDRTEPDVAWVAAGDRFLVAYEGVADVLARVVERDLATGLELEVAATSAPEGAPALAACDDEVLVAWEEAGAADADVAARRLQADGTPVPGGGPWTLDPAAGPARRPAVACSDATHLVAFETGATGATGIVGRLVPAAPGAPDEVLELRPAAGGEAGDPATRPALAGGAAGWLAAWEADRQPAGAPQDVHARAAWRLFADGFEWGLDAWSEAVP